MQIQVPVRYYATGRKTGNRINSSLIFEELLSVELYAPDTDDAPIVARWDDSRPPDLMCSSDWGPSHGEECHVRFDGRTYWRPLMAYEINPMPKDRIGGKRPIDESFEFYILEDFANDADTQHVTAERFLGLAGSGDVHNVLPEPRHRANAKPGIPEQYFETVDSSYRTEAVMPVLRSATDMAVIDGKMYTKCAEPCVAVMSMYYEGRVMRDGVLQHPTRRYNERGYTVRLITSIEQIPNPAKAALFPLQDFKSAIQAARRGNANQIQVKDFLNEANSKRYPNFLDNVVFSEDDVALSEAAASLRQFIFLTETTWDDQFKDTTKVRMFCDLKDAVADMRSEDALDTLERVGEHWLETYGNDGRQEAAVTALKKAVDAASRRPVQVSPPSATRRLGM